jgi:hypothetical protein
MLQKPLDSMYKVGIPWFFSRSASLGFLVNVHSERWADDGPSFGIQIDLTTGPQTLDFAFTRERASFYQYKSKEILSFELQIAEKTKC